MSSHAIRQPLAIVGMACNLPGAGNLDEFWNLLVEGRSELGELPPERFNKDLYFHPDKGHKTKSYTKLGGTTPDRPFDNAATPLPQDLIEQSHKVHLKLYEVAVAACRQAGFDPLALPTKNVGVYIGHTPPSALAGGVVYARQIAHAVQYLKEVDGFNRIAAGKTDEVLDELIEAFRGPLKPGNPQLNMCGNAYHAAGLITRGFDLDGPSMSFDAACASSLRAFGHGTRALQLGQIDMAIIGSASYVHSDCLVLFSQAQSVSPTGTRPFDENADGLVASEGYVALCLKTLEKAEADGDDIQAVIRRIGISSDGKGKSLWAPRHEGQIEAIRRAYDDDANLSDLQYIEMHATSTQVGDATEITALTGVLADVFQGKRKVPVGSVKANVGHTLETAGLASLVKTVLAMKNGVIPKQINIDNLNPSIDWENVPFYVPLEAEKWDAPAPGQPRRAAVNAFGIGGLNVHIAVDEHITGAKQSVPARPADASSVKEPIAIIGMGAVLPGVRTAAALWDVLRSGEDQKREVDPNRWDPAFGYRPGSDEQWTVPTTLGGFITDFEYDWKAHKVPPKQVASADPLQFMLLDAADQAFLDAGYEDKSYERMQTGVVVGTIFCGEFAEQLQMGLGLPQFEVELKKVLRSRGVADADIDGIAAEYQKVLLKHLPALIDETGSFTASTLASRITKTFDLMGGAVAVDSGNASSMAALNCCIDILRAGDCDMMICAAGHRSMGYATYESLTRTGQLTKSQPRGPFDTSADGCVPGEGVGVVLLKRLSDAERDGNKIHGIIRGIGVARKDSLEEGSRLAIERGLKDAGITSSQVAVVEAAATGIPEWDGPELQGVLSSYGSAEREAAVKLGARAGQFGNTGGVSGMLGLMKAVSELNHVEMPAHVGTAQPVEALTADSSNVRLEAKPSALPGLNDDGRAFAGVNSYSQMNVAYHLVVEGATKIPRTPASVERQPQEQIERTQTQSTWRITRIGANTQAELHSQLEHINAASAFETERQFIAADHYRAAIVADSPDDLAKKCQLAAAQLDKPAAQPLLREKGIFLGEVNVRRPLVAFAFSGQGSQYTGMLKTLAEEFAPAAEALSQVNDVLARLRLPSFEELAWREENQLGTDVWRTQLSLLAADTILFAAVIALGVKPDRVCGHSFGELAALVAAGAWTFEDAVRATKARCESIDNYATSAGSLVSTSAPGEVLEELCRQIGDVTVSHYNSPDQTVAGGPPDAVERLAEIVKAQGFQAKVLDVPAAFHTPLMAPVREPFGAALETIPLSPPQVPLLSSVTNRYVADPADVRQNLVEQMTRPVRWTELAERLANENARVLVEIGPRQVLTGLHKRIFADDAATVFVGCDHPKRQGLQQLLAVQACIEATGADERKENPLRIAATSDVPVATKKPARDESTESLERRDGLNVLHLHGSPYDMGFQHGRAMKSHIRATVRRYADMAGSRWDRLRDLDTAVAKAESYFGADELEEMRGIAKGADISPGAVIAHNLRLYLDAGAGGIHFAVTGKANQDGLLHAANEDLQLGLSLRDCLERTVQIRRPAGVQPSVTFGVAGQVGTLNGINSRGVAVTTAALLDVPKSAENLSGPLHTVLVKQVLEQATDVDEALALLRQLRGAAAWSICISHHATDRLCYVEFDGKDLKAQPAPPAVVAANHRLLKTFADDVPAPSQRRFERLKSLLGGEQPSQVSVTQAQSALRDRFDASRGRETKDPNINTVRRVDNQISIVFQPGQGNLWITGGPKANGHQNEFHHLKLDELLPELAPACETNNESSPEPAADIPSAVTADAVAASYRDAAESQSTDVCQRYVMRVVETAPPTEGPLAISGRVLVIGENAVANDLRSQLQQAGLDVVTLPNGSSIDEQTTALEAAWNQAPIPHLILATAHDANAATDLDADKWSSRRDAGVTRPYRLCQKWYQLMHAAKSFAGGSLTAITNLGGDFGIAEPIPGVDGGALAGLVKGVRMELELAHKVPTFRAQIIDTSAECSATDIATAVCRELTVASPELEVGYVGPRRFVLRPVVEPLGTARRADARRSPEVSGAVIVTGGARGVTAEVAKELARRTGCKLHLLGSSQPPEVPSAWHTFGQAERKDFKAQLMKEALANGEKPIDAWGRFEKAVEIDANLNSFADEGLHATYHACDVGDRAALAAVLDEIRAADGAIAGVIHGAGYERAASFEKKKPELVELTIRTKVDGAANLMALTAGDPLQFFAAFGSVSGRFGGVGQTDYCLANDMQAKLVDWYRGQRPNVPACTFHWHAWDDVGMAVRPESKHIAKMHNITFMPAKEGSAHLVNELAAGLPEPEIVITELQFCQAKYADASRLAPPPATPAAITPSDIDEPFGVAAFPLIDGIASQSSGNLVAETRLDPVGDIFLAQHRFKERPMMPVVVTLEALAEAASLCVGEDRNVTAIRDIEIQNGLRFLTDEVQTANVHAAHTADGNVQCDFTCDFHNRKGVLLLKDKPYLRAVVETGAAAKFESTPPGQPAEWTQCWYPEEDVVIWHGMPFRCLQQIAVEGDEAWGRIVAPAMNNLAGPRAGSRWQIPTAALDSCFFACGIVLWWKHRGVVAIPDGIERLDLCRNPKEGENCIVHIKDRGRQENRALYDFTVFGEDGTPVFRVTGYRNVIVAEAPANALS